MDTKWVMGDNRTIDVMRMGEFKWRWSSTGFFRSVVTKKRRESAHARILEGILNGELRACVDSRRFFCDNGPEKPCIN